MKTSLKLVSTAVWGGGWGEGEGGGVGRGGDEEGFSQLLPRLRGGGVCAHLGIGEYGGK
jgi:hypothetical protein